MIFSGSTLFIYPFYTEMLAKTKEYKMAGSRMQPLFK